jgi:hypothetical protein
VAKRKRAAPSSDDGFDDPYIFNERVRTAVHPDSPSEDVSDAGRTRPLLKLVRTSTDTDGQTWPEGTEGLFVWLPEETPNGIELCQVRIGGETHTFPLKDVWAIGPPGHAEVWNSTRDEILKPDNSRSLPEREFVEPTSEATPWTLHEPGPMDPALFRTLRPMFLPIASEMGHGIGEATGRTLEELLANDDFMERYIGAFLWAKQLRGDRFTLVAVLLKEPDGRHILTLYHSFPWGVKSREISPKFKEHYGERLVGVITQSLSPDGGGPTSSS